LAAKMRAPKFIFLAPPRNHTRGHELPLMNGSFRASDLLVCANSGARLGHGLRSDERG
jgi:hypothetical protein